MASCLHLAPTGGCTPLLPCPPDVDPPTDIQPTRKLRATAVVSVFSATCSPAFSTVTGKTDQNDRSLVRRRRSFFSWSRRANRVARLLDQQITKPGSDLALVEIVALDEDRAPRAKPGSSLPRISASTLVLRTTPARRLPPTPRRATASNLTMKPKIDHSDRFYLSPY